jgi:flagellar protein FliJ
MAKKSQRMAVVHGIAEREVDQAVEALGESTRKVTLQESQLTELEQYRQEYRDQIVAQGGQGFSAGKLSQLQQFLIKLDEAITHQHQVVAQVKKQCEQVRLQWLSARRQSQALGTVVERYKNEEQEQLARKEQKEMDEMAQRPRDDKGFS